MTKIQLASAQTLTIRKGSTDMTTYINLTGGHTLPSGPDSPLSNSARLVSLSKARERVATIQPYQPRKRLADIGLEGMSNWTAFKEYADFLDAASDSMSQMISPSVIAVRLRSKTGDAEGRDCSADVDVVASICNTILPDFYMCLLAPNATILILLGDISDFVAARYACQITARYAQKTNGESSQIELCGGPQASDYLTAISCVRIAIMSAEGYG